MQVLHMGRGNPKHKDRLGGERIKSSPKEKVLRMLVDENLNMTQQCALAAQKASRNPGPHLMKCGQHVKGGDSIPLLCCGETTPGALCPVLEQSAQERHGPVGTGPEEGHKNDQGDGTPLL